MDSSFWVGVAFAIGLVGFLIAIFFLKSNLTQSQYNTLHFLTALCGGCAGWFIAGSALFKLDTTIGQNGKLTVSGASGAAFFFTVWFLYPKQVQPPPPDGLSFSVVSGTTFEAMANIIGETGSKFIRFENFTAGQLNLTLNAREVKSTGIVDALTKLRYLNSELPDYTVAYKDDVYTLKAK